LIYYQYDTGEQAEQKVPNPPIDDQRGCQQERNQGKQFEGAGQFKTSVVALR